MDTLTSLRVYSVVAELRSFTAAADRLGLSAAMVTKHVQHLERRVKARLLNRTSRRVSLSEAGARYLERVRHLLEMLDEVEEQIGDDVVAPRGRLKVSLPVWLANARFAKSLAAFHERHPHVQLDLNLTGRMVNLVEEGFDLAIRATLVPEEGLVSRRLTEIEFCLVAAPSWLDRAGRPTQVSDLEGKALLAYRLVMPDGRFVFTQGVETHDLQFTPVLLSDNETLLLHAAREGMGYMMAPKPCIEDDLASRTLERVLAEQINPRAPLYAVYPNRSYLPAKVRVFLDFIADALAGVPRKPASRVLKGKVVQYKS